MNVLSLFDGMSCGRIALKELGITPNIYMVQVGMLRDAAVQNVRQRVDNRSH